MSASFHLFDPQKSVRFVKSTETFESSIQDDVAIKLKGQEIQRFYEDLVNQPSTSGAKINAFQKKAIKVEIKSEPTKKVYPKSGISERDERLFFKAAEHNDVSSVLEYLSKGISINLKDIYGWTALVSYFFN